MKTKEEIMLDKLDRLEDEIIKRLKELRIEIITGEKYTYDIDTNVYMKIAD